MELESAIKHCEETARKNERKAKYNRNHGGSFYLDEAKNCEKCAEEHHQLAEWLKELKKYRDYIPKIEKKYHDAITEFYNLKDEEWKDKSLPLTWDELQNYARKPVWVEEPNLFGKGWILISGFSKEIMWTTHVGGIAFFHVDEIGTGWNAYRKERE